MMDNKNKNSTEQIKNKNKSGLFGSVSWLTIGAIILFTLVGIYRLGLSSDGSQDISGSVNFDVQSTTGCNLDCGPQARCEFQPGTENPVCAPYCNSTTVNPDSECTSSSECGDGTDTCKSYTTRDNNNNCTITKSCTCSYKSQCPAGTQTDIPEGLTACTSDNDCGTGQSCTGVLNNAEECCKSSIKVCENDIPVGDPRCVIKHDLTDSSNYEYLEEETYWDIGEITFAGNMLEYSCCSDINASNCVQMPPVMLNQGTNSIFCEIPENDSPQDFCEVSFEIPHVACDGNNPNSCGGNQYCVEEGFCVTPGCENGYIDGDEVCDNGNPTEAFPVQRCESCQTYRGDAMTCEGDMQARDGLEVVFVLDASETMNTGGGNNPNSCDDGSCKFIDAQDAISGFAQSLDATKDKVGLITFSDCAEVVYGLGESGNTKICGNSFDTAHSAEGNGSLSSQFYSELYNATMGLYTDMGGALKLAAEHISNNHNTSKETIIIFLGDGEPTIGDGVHPANDVAHYGFAVDQAQALHAQFPEMKVYSVGYDIQAGSQAEIIMKNEIASIPAYYNSAEINELDTVFEDLFQDSCGPETETPVCGDSDFDHETDEDEETNCNYIAGSAEACVTTGNQESCTFCNSSCVIETYTPPTGCGDGIQQPNEQCGEGQDVCDDNSLCNNCQCVPNKCPDISDRPNLTPVFSGSPQDKECTTSKNQQGQREESGCNCVVVCKSGPYIGTEPKTKGTSCDDGNPNTVNDTIQEDGCTCLGYIIEEPKPFCGDKIIQKDNGETCDHGALNDGVTEVNGVICDEMCNIVPKEECPPIACSGFVCGDGQEGKVVKDAVYDDNGCLVQCDQLECVCIGTGDTPKTPGVTCDDGDPSTTNDVIQEDGCTCKGLPLVCEDLICDPPSINVCGEGKKLVINQEAIYDENNCQTSCTSFKCIDIDPNEFDLSINKEITSTGPYTVGDSVTYMITIINNSTTYTTPEFSVNDTSIGLGHPTDLIISGEGSTNPLGNTTGGSSSSGGAGGALPPHTTSWNIFNLPPRGETVITYTAEILTANEDLLINTATVQVPGDAPSETVPYQDGTCTSGNNPHNGPSEYAVPGTNNTDCESVKIENKCQDLSCPVNVQAPSCEEGKTLVNINGEYNEEGCQITCDTYICVEAEKKCGQVGYAGGECNYGIDDLPKDSCNAPYSDTDTPETCEYCNPNCTIGNETGEYCGDGKKQEDSKEQCDHGNKNDGSTNVDGIICNNSCEIVPTEVCDPIDCQGIVCEEGQSIKKTGDGTYNDAGCLITCDTYECVDSVFEVSVDKKRIGSSNVYVGDEVTFEIKVRNESDIAGVDIRVEDTLPNGVTFVGEVGNSGYLQSGGATITWLIPNLPANQSITIKYNVKAEIVSSEKMINLVTVTPDPSKNPTETVPVVNVSVTDCTVEPEKNPTTGLQADRSVESTNNIDCAYITTSNRPTGSSTGSSSGGGGGNNYCGDGRVFLERGEECDDGNYIDGDGCSKNCKDEKFEEIKEEIKEKIEEKKIEKKIIEKRQNPEPLVLPIFGLPETGFFSEGRPGYTFGLGLRRIQTESTSIFDKIANFFQKLFSN